MKLRHALLLDSALGTVWIDPGHSAGPAETPPARSGTDELTLPNIEVVSQRLDAARSLI